MLCVAGLDGWLCVEDWDVAGDIGSIAYELYPIYLSTAIALPTCSEACKLDPYCSFFVIVPAGNNGQYSNCFLKNDPFLGQQGSTVDTAGSGLMACLELEAHVYSPPPPMPLAATGELYMQLLRHCISPVCATLISVARCALCHSGAYATRQSLESVLH